MHGALGVQSAALDEAVDLVVVDHSHHELAELREDNANRCMGFDVDDIRGFFERGGLNAESAVHLKAGPLALCLWSGRQPANDARRLQAAREAG